jgi:hemoglobin
MNSLGLFYPRIGKASLQELAKNFYEEVGKIPELRSLYPEDLEAAERRIYLFLAQVLGGPQTYSEERGHPRLRMRHMQWKIDAKMRTHWMNAMLHALDKVPLDQEVREELLHYFTRVANAMINHDEVA